MTKEIKNVCKIEMPIEKVIEGVEADFGEEGWGYRIGLTKTANNVPLATADAVEDIIKIFYYKSDEFKESREALKKTGEFYNGSISFGFQIIKPFTKLMGELDDRANEFHSSDEATREVIEKIVRPIGKKVIAELGIDNALNPVIVNIYTIK